MVLSNYTSDGDILTATDTTPSGTIVYNLGNIAWVLTCSMLVFIMIPGLGFFYSGLLRRKNALTMIAMSLVVLSIASIEWFFWGYSLTFSDSGNPFIGDLRHFGLINVDMQPSRSSSNIPELVFCIFQMMFAAIAPVIMCGAFADRARFGPMLLFVFCWTTIVYNPIASWTWNVNNGWASNLGALDFAGGTPVHISSGVGSLVVSIFLGRRRGYGTELLAYRPYNVTHVVLGTVLLWFGWMGFNSGSGFGANLRAAQTLMATHIAACIGGVTWMLWDWRLERKFSIVGFCSGVVSGLIAITPGCGYVGTPSALVFGVLAGTACNFATQLKKRSGWINRHFIQLGYQLAPAVAGAAWSAIVTTILLFAINYIPGFHFRCSESDEIIGTDLAQIGEEACMVPHLGHADSHMRVLDGSPSKPVSNAELWGEKNEPQPIAPSQYPTVNRAEAAPDAPVSEAAPTSAVTLPPPA
ncbi:hypothetical protein MSPP1_003254 [Malassezia sp. CBS 17886]|nr:hypothetical protein MSPP1_003254 [Malassezia sp. CBS 17886]